MVETGQLRLTPTTTKRFFGLFTRSGLQATRGADGGVSWPLGSLEQRMLETVASAPADLQLVYQALLEVTVSDPVAYGLMLAQRGLLRRGLLEQQATTTLKLITTQDRSEN